MQYYYLVAGLTEYTFDAAQGKLDIRSIRDQIKEQLTDADRHTVELLYTYYDIQNILGYIRNSSLPFNQLGNLTRPQIAALVEAPRERDETEGRDLADEEYAEAVLPPFVPVILDRYRNYNPDEREDFQPIEDAGELEAALYAAFYENCRRSRSEYMRRWSEADRIIRNIAAAYNARALGLDASEMIVDEGGLRETLLQSQASDFGLKDEYEFMDRLLPVLETPDFVERERRMDLLRWSLAETLAEQDYFGIGRVLMYLVQLNILYRWVALDPENGRRSFREMVDTLTDPERISTPTEKK